MIVPLTQFRFHFFVIGHDVFDVLSILFNTLLLYFIIFHTSKAFRGYSIILACTTASELLLGLSAGFVMMRMIPIDFALVYQCHGVCRKISPVLCMIFQALTSHCISYTYAILPLSFWYRHHVIANPSPSPLRIAFYCFLVYIPAFITFVIQFHMLISSEPDRIYQILTSGYPGTLLPANDSQSVIGGYESALKPNILFMLFWICFPVWPGYSISIYFRHHIIKKLNSNNGMSRTTLAGQKKLVKALTIQALIPLFCLSQSGMFIWQQFKLPFNDYLPYYEESIFLSIAMGSAINPCVTIFYVLPYRRRFLEMFFRINRERASRVYHTGTGMTTKDAESSRNSKNLV